jgi:hypothetical protein
MDPVKEANSVTFAAQPEHVKACTLKKIFGESAAHTINFGTLMSFFYPFIQFLFTLINLDVEPCGGTWPRARSQKSRAKLERFFGPFEG